MVTGKRRFFVSLFSINIILILFLHACSLPDPFLDDIADGLASLELFVSKTGNDANDCQTAETACLTVSRAVQLGNDMTAAFIRIAPGMYDETADLYIETGMTLMGEAGVIINRLENLPGIPSAFVISVPMDQLVHIEGVEIHSAHYGVWVHSGRVQFNQVNFVDIATHAIHVDPSAVEAAITVEAALFSNIQGSAISTRNTGITITLRNAVITENYSTPILNYGSTITLDNVIIANNYVDGTYPSAILNLGDSDLGLGTGGIVHISNSAIYNNLNSGAFLTNAAINDGGELLEISNSTISGNSGSAIYINTIGDIWLTHVTIANHANTGILGPDSLRYRVTLQNSLVVYNGRDCNFTTLYDSGIPEGRTVIDNSIDSDNTCRDPLTDERAAWDFYPGVNPVLADNGGGTLTHALERDSPAVDAVDCISGLAADQRGIARPQGTRCDVGAFELDPELGAPPSATSTPLAVIQQTTPNAPPVVQTQVPPYVQLIQNGNCRSGPGTVYAILAILLQGEEFPAEGRNQDNSWWVVNANGMSCWISDIVVETYGPMDSLPVVPAPAIPTTKPNPTNAVAEQPPSAPQQLMIENQVCTGSAYTVGLRWQDTSSNEDGFRVYRDGLLLTTLSANTTQFTDSPPFGGPYIYGVEAFNSAGASSRPTVNEAGCIP